MKKTKDEENQEFRKLLEEYDANSGMAGLVCSRPVELMPSSEQDRIVNGFCTAENLKILAQTRDKLALFSDADLNEAEIKKKSAALAKLDGLIEAFGAYQGASLSRDALRTQVRALLTRPIAESQEALINSLSHLIETLDFLAGQPLDAKDSWDLMVDCVQLHDALSRTTKVCAALQTLMAGATGPAAGHGGAIGRTAALGSSSLTELEAFFRGEKPRTEVQLCFTALSGGLKEIWMESA